MLKIKDNVDLKELEKYGFVEGCTIDEPYYTKRYIKGFYKECITIWIKDRCIQVQAIYLLSALYDLIKADLVEKVESE